MAALFKSNRAAKAALVVLESAAKAALAILSIAPISLVSRADELSKAADLGGFCFLPTFFVHPVGPISP